MTESQQRPEVVPAPSRDMLDPPPAETRSWFLQLKGIFTGAPLPFSVERARGNQLTGIRAPLFLRRIGGDVSTVQKKK